ncbi:hypothetical protein C6503_23025 [Candidatus Poribacteria bacterium]|nr:MAG: hypothetical protein C6503_23025 [Candidatus Poribacteria bacterium]
MCWRMKARYLLLNVSYGGILMRNISLFVEDAVHEDFLVALVQRVANAYNIEINIKVSSVRGGHEKVITELGEYQQDLQHNDEDLPDLIVVGTDSNGKGFLQREKEINQAASSLADRVISMIPKPHIERWLLLDAEAFKKVFGGDCSVPNRKRNRDRYKGLLLQAIHDAGVIPLLGGIEYTSDLVNAMNLQHLEQSDRSFRRFFRALQHRFENWQQIED